MTTYLSRALLVLTATACSAPAGELDAGRADASSHDAGGRGDAGDLRDAGGARDGAMTEPPLGPVVLVPAFHATTTNSWSLERVADVLRAEGHFVHLAIIPQYAGTPERAAVLVGELDAARADFCAARRPGLDPEVCLAGTRAHLVGHSQGGLDARYVVSNLGYGTDVASVTTLSSPHRGTPLGDVGLAVLGDPRADSSPGSTVTAAVRELLEELAGSLAPEGLADGLYWLSEARWRAQEAGTEPAIADVEGVYYQSWAGVATTDGELPDVSACDGLEFFPRGRAAELRGVHDNTIFTAVRLAFDDEHEPNDGHIPVASAKHGDFLGCLPVDHLDLIGRPEDQAAENIELAGFDYVQLYRELSERLLMVDRGEL